MKKLKDVQKENRVAIHWEPLLNTNKIGLIGKDGVITLTGIDSRFSGTPATKFSEKS